MEPETREQIKRDMVRLELSRDSLLEWLLSKTEESWDFRVYMTKHHILISGERRNDEYTLIGRRNS